MELTELAEIRLLSTFFCSDETYSEQIFAAATGLLLPPEDVNLYRERFGMLVLQSGEQKRRSGLH